MALIAGRARNVARDLPERRGISRREPRGRALRRLQPILRRLRCERSPCAATAWEMIGSEGSSVEWLLAMANVLCVVGYGLFTAAVGVGYGWWLGRRNPRSQHTEHGRDELAFSQEVLSCLETLTRTMASSVGEHSSRLKEICEDLFRVKSCEPKTIAAALAKLIDANDRLEQELAASQKMLEEQARQMEAHAFEARTDGLTRLANRRAFDDELLRRFDEFQRHGRPLSLVLIDIDRFKEFNDTHGHQAGDEVLRGIAAALRQRTRTMDLAARYGGEEFAVVMPGAVLEDSREAADRIRKAIAQETFRFEGQSFQITVSVGVAELVVSENACRLLRRADEALYAAKMAGRDSVWYHGGRACFPVRPRAEEESNQEPHATPKRTAGQPPRLADTPPVVKPRLVTPESCGESAEVWYEPALRFADRSAFCQQVRSRLAEWKRGGASFCLLFTEIDGFQESVPAAGSTTRQTIIEQYSRVLSGSTREMDVVARYTPACFAILLPRTSTADAAAVANRLHEQVALTRGDGGEQPAFTISVGLASVGDGDDLVRLLKRTEVAVNSAKMSGGNATHCHNGQWTQSLPDPLALVDD